MSAPEGPLVIGVDSSTQSTKALVVDAATGAGGRPAARRRTPSPRAPAARATPSSGGRRCATALRPVRRRRAREAAAVSVGGQQHGLVTLDADGPPGAPGAAVERRALGAAARPPGRGAGRARRRGPSASAACPAPSFTVTKWAWLRENEPRGRRGDRRRPAAARLPHRAAHRAAARTDRGDASGTGWWALRHRVLRRGDPRARRPGPRAAAAAWSRPGRGRRAPSRRGDLPLPAGTLVAAGTGDNMAAALGLGLRPGTAGAQPRHLGHRVRRLRRTGPPTRPAPSRASPTRAATGCRWPAPSTARSPSTGSPRCWAWTARPSRPAARRSCCPSSTASAPPTCRTPPGCCTDCGTTPPPGRCSRPPTTARSSRCCARSTRCCGRAANAGPRRAAAADRRRREGHGLAGDGPPAVGAARAGARRGRTGRAGRRRAGGGAATGEDPAAVARRWGTAEGELLDPLPRDVETVERIAATLPRAEPLFTAP